MFRSFLSLALLGALLAGSSAPASAQLVDDGATGFVNATTNILASDLTVGNIGTNTTLIFTNAGRVKDTNGYIGYSAGADFNRVILTGTNSVWWNTSDLYIGFAGANNSLSILNRAAVTN